MTLCPSWWHFVSLTLYSDSDRHWHQPAHFASQRWTRGVFFYFYWDSPVILVLSFSTRGMQLFLYLQVYGVGGGRYEKSFRSSPWLSCHHAESLPERSIL